MPMRIESPMLPNVPIFIDHINDHQETCDQLHVMKAIFSNPETVSSHLVMMADMGIASIFFLI